MRRGASKRKRKKLNIEKDYYKDIGGVNEVNLTDEEEKSLDGVWDDIEKNRKEFEKRRQWTIKREKERAKRLGKNKRGSNHG